MNCEICQELIHDLLDGSISQTDESILNTHLRQCLDCESVRQDPASIVGFCRTQRGLYEAPPNEQALWLRIRNVVEADGLLNCSPSAPVIVRPSAPVIVRPSACAMASEERKITQTWRSLSKNEVSSRFW